MSARATRSRVTTKAKSASDSVKRGTRPAAGSEGNGKGSKYFGGKRKAGKRAELDEDEDEDGDLQDEGEGEVGEDGDGDATESESEAESLHSDALDDEDEEEEQVGGKGRKGAKTGVKRKRAAGTASPKKTPAKKAKASPRKKRKTKKEESDGEESEFELEEGQEVVGVVVQAPKTGRVPPGQISKNTLDFLSQLKKPECNDREWYNSVVAQPVYRLAETEWKAFVEHFTDILVDADPQIPHLPPKDVIHRIYRDVRFSNDKTPYKKGFSASFSRSGRKGIFAGCESHVSLRPRSLPILLHSPLPVKPGDESLIAAGSWCPGKNELATIRSNLQRSSRRLREVISAPDFEALFGPARPHPKGERQNIFGMEDELKVAPKGIDKTHKDIDLLKCRSFAVVYRFTDKQVLSPEFKTELAHVAKVMRPFVHCLNDLMTIQDASDSSDSDSGGEEDDGDPDES
ncbi:hypothetical protein C8Q76DRAFT_627185 [Earliella scabrosa]|nr:hypothetical protein C8Q76DRAFT_627185 [Earliella scabrosa]